MSQAVSKGRPRTVSDEVILRAAFTAFAAAGYDAMSVRRLNAGLGLSHETVRQRFGAKRDLYRAAVDHGVARFYALLDEERATLPGAASDLEELRFTTRAFIVASLRVPELGNLINHEVAQSGERLEYIFSSGFVPGIVRFGELLDRLAAADVIYPLTIRDAFFLVDAGISPYSQVGLSRAFDSICGPLDERTHIDDFLDFIFRALVKPRGE